MAPAAADAASSSITSPVRSESAPGGSNDDCVGATRPPSPSATSESAPATPNRARPPTVLAGVKATAVEEVDAPTAPLAVVVTELELPRALQEPAQNVEAEWPSAVSVPPSSRPVVAVNWRARRSAAPPAPISAAMASVVSRGPLPEGAAVTGAEGAAGTAALGALGSSTVVNVALGSVRTGCGRVVAAERARGVVA